MSLKDSIKQLQKREHITQDELMRRLGCTRSSIMEGNSAEVAATFDYAFGENSIHDSHNDDKLRKGSRESKELEKLLPWARKFPIRTLQSMGLIPTNVKDADLVRAIFRFMQIGSIAGFKNYYSTTLQSMNPQTYAAWIRLGELRIERSTTEYTPDYEAILSNLKFLRTNVYLYGQKLRNIAREALNNCGIEIIEVEPFLTAPTPTCAFYWRGYRPVIQFPTTKMDDAKFLEALFHAVAHVLYHPLRTSCLQLGNQMNAQCTPATAKNIQEIEAETFAQNIMLSEAEECELICCGRFNERRCIQHFSGLFHVRPGILVERLQQQGKIKRNSLLNDFKIAV
ncbi:hypothetical protein SAMN05720759_110103 [Fibrobacter sp. UWB12]|nr:hypothetical protein SAMN05720759_110103 [Fibrobacter sp. UWB12]